MSRKIDNQQGASLAVDGKGPWDAPASGGGDASRGKGGQSGGAAEPASEETKTGPRNPWEPTVVEGGKRQRGPSLEDLLRRTGGGKGGGGFGGLPPARRWQKAGGRSSSADLLRSGCCGPASIAWGLEQEGVVTFLGKYSRTVGPGIQFTLPSPLERIQKVDTKQIQTTSVGSPKASSENLVLTKDQSIIDMAYDVRWSIKDPELYLFQLDNADGTVKEVAESACARQSLTLT